MNHYTELLRYVRSLSDEDPFVNTTTQGIDEDMDLDKGNIYPLFNIELFDMAFPPNTITYQLEMTCLQQRDTNKKIDVDKFWLQDNKVDNFNEAGAVLNRIIGKMRKDFGDTEISIEVPNVAGKMSEWGVNTLDGWSITVTVKMPNVNINLCS
jgi:hypothetical protein